MYQAAYGLNRMPFGMTPDPASLFMTPSHREALAGLTYGVVNHKGFIVLIGDAGTGKTTLIRKLMTMLPTPVVESSILINPTLTPSEFLELVLDDFGVGGSGSKANRLSRLNAFLSEVYKERKTAILIVDEAHKLSPEVLEEIRLLTNFETDDDKLLQIVLAGQTELRGALNRHDLRQLKQRIAVRLEIGPLSASELRDYLQFRWKAAGGSDPIPFSDPAIEAIAFWSAGIPRLVNAICDNALLLASGDDPKLVNASHVLEVVHDLDLGGDAAAPEPLPLGNATRIIVRSAAHKEWPGAQAEPPRAPVPNTVVQAPVQEVPAAAPAPAAVTVPSIQSETPKHPEEPAVPSLAQPDDFGALPILERYTRKSQKSLLGRWSSLFV